MLKWIANEWAKFKEKTDYYDYNLAAVIILITCFGLIMLYSTSAYTAELNYGNDMYFFAKQAKISGAALIIMLVGSRLDYHALEKLTVPVYIIAAVTMIAVPFIGIGAKGAKRWLAVGGQQFQPSEVAKLAIIIGIPHLIVALRKNLGAKELWFSLICGGGLSVLALIATDNLSTAIIIGGITVGLLFLSYPRSKWFYILGVIGIVLVAGVVFYLYSTMDTSTDFRIRRVLVWLNPEKYSELGGYQVLQGLYAIGSGGLFGKGLGNSTQKLGAVPEAQNDMIFSIICEELGVFGGVIIIILFGYLLYRLFFIAQNAPDLYGSLTVSGIFIHISLQVILNICVVINLIPTTGITLPFMSYGGTSLLFLMVEMCIALSVARRIKFKEE